MKWMNGKSLALYSVAGFFCALTALALFEGFSETEQKYRSDPAMRAYEAQKREYVAWREEWFYKNRASLDRQQFEEALAGIRTPENVDNRQLQRLTTHVRGWVISGQYDPTRAARQAKYRFLESNEHADYGSGLQPLLYCRYGGYSYTCVPTERTRILAEPDRLAKALSGDKSVVYSANGDRPASPESVRQPPVPPTAAAALPPVPFWLRLAEWLIASLAFAFGFCLTGTVARYGYTRGNCISLDYTWHGAINGLYVRNGWSPPLDSLPKSAIGWLVYASMAPGMLAAHGLNLLTKDARPAVARLVRKLRPKDFDEELARLAVKVEVLKKLPNVSERLDLVAKLEAALNHVRSNHSDENLDQLERLVDEINGLYDAEAGLDKWLKDR